MKIQVQNNKISDQNNNDKSLKELKEDCWKNVQ